MLEVTVIMATYGQHKHLTEEAIESFLRQTYPAKKLLVFNTHPEPIVFSEPLADVEVVNHEDIFDLCLQEKMRHIIRMVETPVWCVLDDDDIILPWHLTNLVKAWAEKKSQVNIDVPVCASHENMIFLEHNVIRSVTQWDMWPCCLFEKPNDYFLRFLDTIYTDKDSAFQMDQKVKQWNMWHKSWITYPTLPSFIYRWDTGSSHLSGHGGDLESQKRGYDEHRQRANEKKRFLPWRPHWDHDYVELVRDFIRDNQPLQYNNKTLIVPEDLKKVI